MARDKEGRDIQFSRTDSSNIARNCSRVEIYSKCCFERFVVAIEISRDHFVSSISRNDFFGSAMLYARGVAYVWWMDVRNGETDGRMDGRAGEGAYETIRFEQLSATTSLKFSVSAPWWNECLSL